MLRHAFTFWSTKAAISIRDHPSLKDVTSLAFQNGIDSTALDISTIFNTTGQFIRHSDLKGLQANQRICTLRCLQSLSLSLKPFDQAAIANAAIIWLDKDITQTFWACTRAIGWCAQVQDRHISIIRFIPPPTSNSGSTELLTTSISFWAENYALMDIVSTTTLIYNKTTGPTQMHRNCLTWPSLSKYSQSGSLSGTQPSGLQFRGGQSISDHPVLRFFYKPESRRLSSVQRSRLSVR